MRHIYDIGDEVTLTATFTDPETEELVDPEAVACTVLTGAKKTLTPSVTKASKGVYIAKVQAASSGTWHYAFDGTGGHVASQEGSFEVRPQAVPR
jgi:hypothetical protein